MEDYFQLIGPKRFIRVVIDDLISGKSVVLQTPQAFCGGIVEAVKRETQNQEILRWIELDDCEVEDPLKYLCRRFRRPSAAPDPVASFSLLYGLPDFAGRVISLPPADIGQMKVWLKFVAEFAEYSKGVDEFRRTQFILHVKGSRNPAIQNTELLLACRVADGILDVASALYFAYGLIQGRALRRLERRLIAQICASLALWDMDLSARLGLVTLDQLLNPERELLRYAQECRWNSPREMSEDMKWGCGVIHAVDGVDVQHSAYLAAKGDMDAVRRRIWSAEVAVLFPHLECCRRKVLDRYGNLIQLPFIDGSNRRIEILEDLEISNVMYQLNARGLLPRSEYLLLKSLRDARNALAHGDVVGIEDLRCILRVDM